MELQDLANNLSEMNSLCEQLVSLLIAKREAMKSLRVNDVQDLLMEEELLLERVRAQDLEFKEAITAVSRRYGVSPEGFLARPEARGLRTLKDSIKGVQQRIREESQKTLILAEHVSGFLKQMQGEAQAPLTYSPRSRTYPPHQSYSLH